VIDLGIHMVTSCFFVAQWSEPSNDPVCGTVRYIVTVYTGGIMISNDAVEETTYTATGLCSNTLYEINVTAINDAGSNDSVTKQVMTNKTGMIYPCYYVIIVLCSHALVLNTFIWKLLNAFGRKVIFIVYCIYVFAGITVQLSSKVTLTCVLNVLLTRPRRVLHAFRMCLMSGKKRSWQLISFVAALSQGFALAQMHPVCIPDASCTCSRRLQILLWSRVIP